MMDLSAEQIDIKEISENLEKSKIDRQLKADTSFITP